MRALGWVPQDISYLQSFDSLVDVFSHRNCDADDHQTRSKGRLREGGLFSATC